MIYPSKRSLKKRRDRNADTGRLMDEYFLRFGRDYFDTRTAPCQRCRQNTQRGFMEAHHKFKRNHKDCDRPEERIAICGTCHIVLHLDRREFESVRDSEANITNGLFVKSA